MRISNIMTHGVKCAESDCAVADAAKLMLNSDIGAVPIVENGRPVGMLTDRDIAVRVVAAGRDPLTTRVGAVMTTDLVCCRSSDSLDSAARVMEKNQVRRLLVLEDDIDRLCGILSLGDLAVRTSEDMLTEEVLEKVSQPGHGGGTTARSGRGGRRNGRHAGRPAVRRSVDASIPIAVGVATGAALMYLFDPQRGRRRRAMIRDKAVRLAHDAQCGLGKTSRYVRGQARGLAARAGSLVRSEHEVDDVVLHERVRSAIGRAVSHPGAIHVDVRDGTVLLSGLALSNEVRSLIRCVSKVRGVHDVVNDLDVRATAGDEPSLQGSPRRAREHVWSPTARALGVGAGLALLAWGLWRRDRWGAAAVLGGAGSLARGMTNLPAKRLVGLGAGRRAVDVQKTITINAPIESVFQFFSEYESFPHFMSRVCEVRDLGGGRSHWVVKGPAGIHVSWDAEMTCFEPNEMIAWRSVPGSVVASEGVIRFESMLSGGARVTIMLSYNPPGGALGHLAAAIFGADPKSDMDADLVRLKTMIETGHPAHDAAQPVAGPQMIENSAEIDLASRRAARIRPGALTL